MKKLERLFHGTILWGLSAFSFSCGIDYLMEASSCSHLLDSSTILSYDSRTEITKNRGHYKNLSRTDFAIAGSLAAVGYSLLKRSDE